MRRAIGGALVVLLALASAGVIVWLSSRPDPSAGEVAAALERSPEGRGASRIRCRGGGGDWLCHVTEGVGSSDIEVHVGRDHRVSIAGDTGRPPFRVCCAGG